MKNIWWQDQCESRILLSGYAGASNVLTDRRIFAYAHFIYDGIDGLFLQVKLQGRELLTGIGRSKM